MEEAVVDMAVVEDMAAAEDMVGAGERQGQQTGRQVVSS